LASKKAIGFSVSTSGASAVDLVTNATVKAAGRSIIKEVHLKVSVADGYLGLGVTATTTAGINIIPLFQDTFVDLEDVEYSSLSIIRAAATNVTVAGFVVVN